MVIIIFGVVCASAGLVAGYYLGRRAAHELAQKLRSR
jgi:uncharacterized protein YneF (UPF0154 family)